MICLYKQDVAIHPATVSHQCRYNCILDQYKQQKSHYNIGSYNQTIHRKAACRQWRCGCTCSITYPCVTFAEVPSDIEHFHAAHVHLSQNGDFGTDELAVPILALNDVTSALNLAEHVFPVVRVVPPALVELVAGVEATLADFNPAIVLVGLADLVSEVITTQCPILIPVETFVCSHICFALSLIMQKYIKKTIIKLKEC